ncbi:MAG: TonB-dependent receptor [Bacteroidota bacterium]
MHAKSNKNLFSFLCFLYFLVVTGQENIAIDYNNTPLKTVLADLEEKTGLLFSYSDERIADVTITKTATSIEIDTLLDFISSKTGLLFERIGENQVIISLPNGKSTVCGYLFDVISKAPLPYATIVVKGTNKGFTSDENGYFLIENETLTSGVLLQYIGYATRLVFPADFGSSACKNIFLNPQAESLREVIVKSYLIAGIDKNKDGSISLSVTEQAPLPGNVEPDVFQSAQWLPGITTVNETVSDVQIRGGSPDQNLILFDGIKLYNTGHFFGMVSIFNPNITTDARIFKGGASPEFGDRISGVIDISGETQIPSKTTGGIGLNGTQADAHVKVPLGKKVGFVASARRSYADIGGLATPTFDAISEKVFQNTVVGDVPANEENDEDLVEGEETFFFYDANLKLIFRPSETDSIYLSGLLTRNDLNFRLQIDENLERDILTSENNGVSFEWKGKKGEHFKHAISTYYTNYESTYQNLFSAPNGFAERNLRRNSVKDYGITTSLAYLFSEKHKVQLGYQRFTNDVFYQISGDEDGNPESGNDSFNEILSRKNTTNSMYTAYTYRPQNRGFFNLGIRVSQFSLLDDWYWEPRLNFEYPIGKTIRLKLTGEQRYQAISQLVEFDDTRLRLQSGIWTLTDNENFPLLESTQFSAGLLFDSNGWTLDIDGYLKNVDGLTTFTNGFTNAEQSYSIGSSTIFGLDVLLKKKLGNFNFWLGYTHNNVDYEFAEIDDASFPGNNDITHNLTLSNVYENGNWRFSVGWNYRTGAPFTQAIEFNNVSNDIIFGPINGQRFPDYHRLDASAQYRFQLSSKNKSSGIIGFSLQNIYNRQIPLSVFYQLDFNPETGQEELEQLEQLSLGLTPNFLLRFSF